MKNFPICLYCGHVVDTQKFLTPIEQGYDCDACGFSIRVHQEGFESASEADTVYWNPEYEKKQRESLGIDTSNSLNLPGWWTDVPDGCLLVVNGDRV